MVACRLKFLKHIIRALFCLILFLSVPHVILSNIGNTGNTGVNDTKIAYAMTNEDSPAPDNIESKRVYDEAGILTDDEIEKLEAISLENQEQSGLEIFILTHNDSDSTYPEKYIEDFEEQLPVADRVYFLYDLYRGEIFMEGYGLAETYIHSKRIDIIFDNVVDDLKNGYYFDAFETYITLSAAYMEDDSELNYDHDYIYDNPPKGFDPESKYDYDDYNYNKYYREEKLQDNMLLNFWFQLVAALVIGAVVVGAMAYNSGGRMTAGSRDYLDRSRMGLIGRRDQYIRSSVTKWRKPSNNSSGGGNRSGGAKGGFNSGGFRGGVSSGGRSHSSGGRKL